MFLKGREWFQKIRNIIKDDNFKWAYPAGKSSEIVSNTEKKLTEEYWFKIVK